MQKKKKKKKAADCRSALFGASIQIRPAHQRETQKKKGLICPFEEGKAAMLADVSVTFTPTSAHWRERETELSVPVSVIPSTSPA